MIVKKGLVYMMFGVIFVLDIVFSRCVDHASIRCNEPERQSKISEKQESPLWLYRSRLSTQEVS